MASFPQLARALDAKATGGAYDASTRWLVVYHRVILGRDHMETTEALAGIHKSTQKLIVDRFLETGDVQTWQGRREAPPHNRVLSAENDLYLLGMVADDPCATLEARNQSFRLATGKRVHVSSICRAMHRLDLSYQKARPPKSTPARRLLPWPPARASAGAWATRPRPTGWPRARRCSTGRPSGTSRRRSRSSAS